MKKDLLPCPFCGSENIKVISDIKFEDGHVECCDCGIEAHYSDCVKSAIELWNVRKKENK